MYNRPTISQAYIVALFGFLASLLSCQMDDTKQWDNPADPDGANYHLPSLRVESDTLFVDPSKASMRVVANSPNARIAKVEWFVDGHEKTAVSFVSTDSTMSIPLKGLAEASHKVVVHVQDGTGLWSSSDSARFRIWNEPPKITKVHDTSLVGNGTLTVKLVAKDDDGTISRIYWGLSKGSWTDSSGSVTLSPKAEVTQKVYWMAKDDLGKTTVDSFVATFTNKAPELTKVRDTTLSWNQMLTVKLSAKDFDGTISRIYWGLNKDAWSDSSGTVVLSPKAEVTRTVYWMAKDDLGKTTVDSFVATFTNQAPELIKVQDTAISTRNALVFALAAHDVDGTVAQYLFDTTGGRWDSTAEAPTLQISSSSEAVRTIRWGVRDNLGKTSLDTFVVDFLDKPVSISIRDTSLSASKMLSVVLVARDIEPTGRIVKYLWSTSGNGWTDSSDQGGFELQKATGGVEVVRWAARNDMGKLSSVDTFRVSFVPAPTITSLDIERFLRNWNGTNGTSNVSWSGLVPGFVDEPVAWMLRFGTHGNLANVYQGSETSWNITGVDTGVMKQYELVGKNRFGDSVVEIDSAQSIYVSQSTSNWGVPWSSTVAYGYVSDTRDGQRYFTVKIGTQTWMAQNLNYADSGSLGLCPGRSDGINIPDSCSKYGRLYTWSEVMQGSSSSNASPSGVKGICPTGWHVPSDAEWTTLQHYANASDTTAGNKLKSTAGWNTNSGTDLYGFRALPAGSRYNQVTSNAGEGGYWWTATESSPWDVYFWSIYHSHSDLSHYPNGGRFESGNTQVPSGSGMSLRCVQD